MKQTMTPEKKEDDTRITLHYNCTSCSVFKGQTIVKPETKEQIAQQIRDVWVGHWVSMHAGKGELLIKYD